MWSLRQMLSTLFHSGPSRPQAQKVAAQARASLDRVNKAIDDLKPTTDAMNDLVLAMKGRRNAPDAARPIGIVPRKDRNQ